MSDAALPLYTPQRQSQSSAQLSHLERLPMHLLLGILQHLSLPSLVFGVKATSIALHSAASSVVREWALPLWRVEVGRAKASRGGGATSTDPLGDQTDTGSTSPSSPAGCGTIVDSTAAETNHLPPRSRELAIFDLFIVSLARSSALLDASTLFSSANDSSALSAAWSGDTGSVRQDLFGLMQPRARCEDLVVREGRLRGLISLGEKREGKAGEMEWRIRAQDVQVEIKPKEVKLLLPFESSSGRAGSVVYKAVLTARRWQEDCLEVLAHRVCDGLARVNVRRRQGGGGVAFYEAR
ncbi:hypothetical protein JCM11641_005700 [Rhodosporidiobolus odoratus]